jgi:3-oxoacyl-[acyl-carrier protein] reductase
MNAERRSLVVGDHEALEAVCDELAARGDHVLRVRSEEPEAGLAGVPMDLDGRAVDALVIGFSATAGPAMAPRSHAVVRAVVDGFGAAGGRVVLIAGRDYLGWPGRAEAAIGLAGVVALARSLALELGHRGVTVNAVCPPAELGPQVPTIDPWAAPPPALTGRVEAADVAYAVAFLTHPDSAYITGQVIHVSGGLSVLSSLTA